MRTRAFGEEPEHTLLAAETVAQSSLDVLISELTGQVIDVRRAPGEAAQAVPAQTPRVADEINAASATVG